MSDRKRTRLGARQRRRGAWALGGTVALVLALGLWAWLGAGNRSTGEEKQAYAPVDGPLSFPARVMAAPAELRALYEFAARRPDVLHYLPCFCGCGNVHRSNYDCFIDEVRADGTVLIDSMSFT